MCNWSCFFRRVIGGEIGILFSLFLILSSSYFMLWIFSIILHFSINVDYIQFMTLPFVELFICVMEILYFIYCSADCFCGCGSI